ncbi:MAG: M48 family metallopeptidase [Firmicutes bacterium]|nr:M48 family metallopeptidase [Bacillota bacterium]
MASNLIIEDIQIEVRKKKIKNLYLSVHPPDGSVRISAPLAMSDEAIRDFALAKLDWIRKQQAKLQKQVRPEEKQYIAGENHYFQGLPYVLNVLYTGKKQRAELKNGQIELYVRQGSTQEQREKVMREWYRSELKKLIPPLIAKWEEKIGVTVNFWGVKLMKTKWGSCNPRAKRIWFNLELAKQSPRCLEYIVVHEMVHLLERHHNKRFYAYLEKFLPDWKECREELNIYL